MRNTTFTYSDESSHCSALWKHLKQKGGRESQQDWEGMCIASDEWHNAQAAAAQMPKVGPLLLQLDPSWSFELQADTSRYGILLQHSNAETACYTCLFHSETETLMGNQPLQKPHRAAKKYISALLHQTLQELTLSWIFVHLSNAKAECRQPHFKIKTWKKQKCVQ